VNVAERFFSIAGSVLTRPTNTTPYSINDAVSNSATASAVTPLTFIRVAESRSFLVAITEVLIMSTDTGAINDTMRAWVFNSDPTLNSGVVGGDNAAFSVKQAGFMGTLSGTLGAFSNGAGGRLVPDVGSYIIMPPELDTSYVYMLLQTLTAFTPSANSTTFTPYLRGVSGRS